MRLKIKLRPSSDNKKITVPIHYQAILQGIIYHSLDKNKAFQEFLHDEGYIYKERKFKLFTYSRLIGPAMFDKKRRCLVFNNTIDWVVGSVLPEFISVLAEKFLVTGEIKLGQETAVVESVLFEKRHPFTNKFANIYMLSPITIYSTFEKEGGGHFTHYFQPKDEAFSQLLMKNCVRKYEAYYHFSYNEPLDFKPIKVTERDKVITKYKDLIVNAWNGSYRLTAAPKMMELLYSVGLGSKNSQGFGMFDLF